MTARGNRTRRWLCVIALLSAAPASEAAADYRTVDVEGLRITFDTDWAPRAAPGYLPLRLDITNLGDPRIIEIVGYGTRFYRRPHGGGRPGTFDLRYPLRLARGDRIRLTIPVPIYTDHENFLLDLREDGRVLERLNIGVQSNHAPANTSALIVAGASTDLGRVATGLVRKVATGRGASAGGGPLDFVLEPARLPTTWLGYTSVRAVFLGPAEWQQLKDDQRTALLTWAACGGDLVFVDGTLDALLPAGSVRSTPDGTDARAYFFGRIHVPSLQTVASVGLGTVLATVEKKQDADWALPVNSASDWGNVNARGFRLPIPGVGGVPARMYLLILLVFSALIGPVNYWFLKRRGRQVLLVLTTPVISGVFILLLAGYVIAGEGIGVRARAVSFTMLDEARKQAVTRASVSLYAAGMSPSGGLAFARDVAVFPLVRDSRPGEAHMLDLSERQRYAAGLLDARTPSNLELVGFRAARERLAFHRDGANVTVVNGFGTRLLALLYRDASNVYSLTQPLGTGETGTLTIGARHAADVIPGDVPLSVRLRYLVEHQPAGSYLAILERSPFWSAGVSNLDERGSLHVVLGWPGGQP